MIEPKPRNAVMLEVPTSSVTKPDSELLVPAKSQLQDQVVMAVSAVGKLLALDRYHGESSRFQQWRAVASVYALYLSVAGAEDDWASFSAEYELVDARSDSSRANTLVRHIFAKADAMADRPQMSLWSTVLEYAEAEAVPASEMMSYLASNHGMVKIAKNARKQKIDVAALAQQAAGKKAKELEFRARFPGAEIANSKHDDIGRESMAIGVVEKDEHGLLTLVAVQRDSGTAATKLLAKLVENNRAPTKRVVGNLTRHQFTGSPRQPRTLSHDHLALVNMRSLFPHLVRSPSPTERIIKSGFNNRKLGRVVIKGDWRNFPIYTYSLEERATCPTTCLVLGSCFADGMGQAHAFRYKHGPDLEKRLPLELEILAAEPVNRNGFVIGVHTVGDVYSAQYASLFAEWLTKHPNLHIWSYTAHSPDSEIGLIVEATKQQFPDRYRVRWSGRPGEPDSTSIINDVSEFEDPIYKDSVICPVDLQQTDCCATCALCWQSRKHVVFIHH